MAVKIHVEPHLIQGGKPGIVVHPDDENRWPFTTHVTVRCTCGNVAAVVTQIGTAAHVIVDSVDLVEAVPVASEG